MRSPFARIGRLRLAALLAVAVPAVAAGVLGYLGELLRQPELDTVDARFAIRGEQAPPRDVVVVAIDDVSFDELRVQWPFPRSVHARVVDRLREAGARAIGYDVQFTEPTDPREDNALIEAVDRARGVVLATTEVDERGRSAVFGGGGILAEIGARAGNANVEPDGDGITRRVGREIDGLAGFSTAIVESATGRPVDRSLFDRDGEAVIDFAGPPGTVRTLSLSRVLRGRFDPALVRDRIVVVGPTAPSLQDVHPTAAARDRQMSGAELHANAVATILAGTPLRDAPPWLDLGLIALMGLALPAAGLWVRSLKVLVPLALALGALYALATQLAFDAAGLILPFVYPVVALAVALVGTIAAEYLTEAYERQRMRDVFGRFVPDQIVDEALACATGNRLGGVERECTVMFSDLRGFTGFSERLRAEQVIDVVNRYLGLMSDAILEAGGTLIAYMGDGIMALFGAPIDQPDHADRALAAAREMTGPRLAAFNTWLADCGLAEEGFRMGVGLNTGKVMAGNVGSERRLEYTAIGDTTNTASRLEGLTKDAPHMVLMAASTRAALTRPPDDLVRVGDVDVRGREAKLEAWAVPDPSGVPAPV